jgi:hypothetical protein
MCCQSSIFIWSFNAEPSNSMRHQAKMHAPPTTMRSSSDRKKGFWGKCFHCLASDHQVAHCREPRHCLNWLGSGHFVREYKAPLNHISNIPNPSISSLLIFPPNSITGPRRRPEGRGGGVLNGSQIFFFARISLCPEFKTLSILCAIK